MAASASPISKTMKPRPSSARKETDSAPTASTSAATRRARPALFQPAGSMARAAPGAGAATGSGLKPALRIAARASASAAASAVIAIVRSPSRKRSAPMPATGSSARRISDSSTAQSMVGMRNSVAPLGRSAGSGADTKADTEAEPQPVWLQQASCAGGAAAGAWP